MDNALCVHQSIIKIQFLEIVHHALKILPFSIVVMIELAKQILQLAIKLAQNLTVIL